MANVGSFLAALSAPTGLWAIILNWIEKGVVNYGWVIILFTLLIKVCMSPLDFLMKFTTKKQTLMQQKLAPQMARINKKYANNPTEQKAQINALYKREGGNQVVSCLVMLVNLVLTMVVFFTLFSSLRVMSAYKAINQYVKVEESYVSTLKVNAIDKFKADINAVETFYVKVGEDQEGNDIIEIDQDKTYSSYESVFEGTDEAAGIFANGFSPLSSLTEEQIKFLEEHYVAYDEQTKAKTSFKDLIETSTFASKDAAVEAANQTWLEVKDNWLWVDNIWVADSYKSPIPTYSDLQNLAKNSKNKEYINYVANNIDQTTYNTITTSVHAKNNRWNGYFILAVLAAVTSFLSQWVTERMSKPKNKQVSSYVDQANPAGGTMKFMKILLPALMVIFVLTSSAGFGIYIVVNSIISVGISALTSVIVDACYKKKQQEVLEYLEKETMKQARRSQRGLNK